MEIPKNLLCLSFSYYRLQLPHKRRCILWL
uniref:Uncharacterized protein n=1 Tax=Arundo donax TaxID=35708 RepID=A0A0A9A4E9_ARUDO